MSKPYAMTDATKDKIRAYQREYHRNYNTKYPEKIAQYKIATCTHFLNKHDRLVIPLPPAPPWTAEAEQDIISSALISMTEQFEDRFANGKVILLTSDEDGDQNG